MNRTGSKPQTPRQGTIMATPYLFNGLNVNVLNQVQLQLQKPVSRELHAFCHLCPADSPAATELVKLNNEELLQWSKVCKEAIDRWCCCPRDYEATPGAPSITTRDSTVPRKVKMRDGRCILTKGDLDSCDAAHIFPYSLGKSQNHGSPSLWRVLSMFWGIERKEKLYGLIFGEPNSTLPDSKTRINGLHNMVTLDASVHRAWAAGKFILEPLEEGSNTRELKARVLWMPKRSTGPTEIGVDTDPLSLESTPIKPTEMCVDFETVTRIVDGHIVTFKTSDPEKLPLPDRDLLMLQSFLIRTLRMAGRAGEDMLETFDTDDEVSSVAAANSGQSEQHTTVTTHETSYHEKHCPEELSFPATSSSPPELSTDISTSLEKHKIPALKQPPQNHDPSAVHRFWLRLRMFFNSKTPRLARRRRSKPASPQETRFFGMRKNSARSNLHGELSST